MGFGGVMTAHRATTLARSTIERGIKEPQDLERWNYTIYPSEAAV